MKKLAQKFVTVAMAGLMAVGATVGVASTDLNLDAFTLKASAAESSTVSTDGLYYYSGSTLTGVTDFSKLPANYTIPEEIDGYAITAIGESAFLGCTSITELTIPESITSIGSVAFKNCININKINFNSPSFTVYSSYDNTYYQSFANCTGVTEVEFGPKVKTIPAYVCANLTSLKKVTFLGEVQAIGAYAFNGCTSLRTFTLPSQVTILNEGVFRNCSSLLAMNLDNIVAIGESAFLGCTSITELAIPESVTSIGSVAFKNCININKINFNSPSFTVYSSYDNTYYQSFANCTGVTEVEFGPKVKTIPAYVCANLTSLKKVTFLGEVQVIGAYAFNGCTSLRTFTLPSQVTILNEGVFRNCSSLISLNLDNITRIGKSTFAGCKSFSPELSSKLTSIGESAFEGCTSITELNIPERVTSIGSVAFKNCININKINFNSPSFTVYSSYNNTYYQSFANCTGVTEVEFGPKVKSVPAYVCADMTSLTTVTFKGTVSSIGNYAFYNCPSLSDIYYHGTKTNWNALILGNNNPRVENAQLKDTDGEFVWVHIDGVPDTPDTPVDPVGPVDPEPDAPATTIAIADYKETLKVDYNATTTFKAAVENAAGKEIKWYVNGKYVASGESYTVKSAINDYTIQCKTVDADGNVVESLIETVSVEPKAPVGPTTITIADYKETLKVDYNSTTTFKAVVENTAGKEIKWYVNGEYVGSGESYTVKNAVNDYTIQCKTVDANGNTVESQVEFVDVETEKQPTFSFFEKIINLFRTFLEKLFSFLK